MTRLRQEDGFTLAELLVGAMLMVIVMSATLSVLDQVVKIGSRADRRVDLQDQAPANLAGQPVARIMPLDTGDGLKFWLADGSWLLVRASGTEPLVRIYTEATSADTRAALRSGRGP